MTETREGQRREFAFGRSAAREIKFRDTPNSIHKTSFEKVGVTNWESV